MEVQDTVDKSACRRVSQDHREAIGEIVLEENLFCNAHLVPGRWRERTAVAGPRSPGPTSGQGPAAVGRTQAARMTKYNEFHGGVRCHTYNSRRPACTPRGRTTGSLQQLAGAAHGEEATAAGANSNIRIASLLQIIIFITTAVLYTRFLLLAICDGK